MSKYIAAASLILILLSVNWLIVGKENHLTRGRIVYLALAPVDPRSLMQGDYMALRFQLAEHLTRVLREQIGQDQPRKTLPTSDAYVVVRLDAHGVATFTDRPPTQPLAANELLLHYRIRGGEVKLATNAFFFQEGHGHFYEAARYGQFRVDGKGELLLVAMYDKDLKELTPVEKQK
ncbi:GDYXXLXY domain-containing protein [uncultured Vibrio sp.]|uniref:GDYXXLXY domain-containing protein n=1 Tax=uncultured Vibrio sp. TaxID=114054 RepID=UPI002AA6D46A|nr:GDYXXLXY domain-containing protein [uncultured Vibrio sp.]